MTMKTFENQRTKRRRSISSTSSSSSTGSRISINSSLSTSEHHHNSSLPTKYHRSNFPTTSSTIYTCTLPPTCNDLSRPPSTFETQKDLERHQECFHRFICHAIIRDRVAEEATATASASGSLRGDHGSGENQSGGRNDNWVPTGFVTRSGGRIWKECGKVFPEERLFELHQIEVHDPIAREKQNRGEKIFECFLPITQCSKKFMTPSKRRRHLIDKHKYPQQYFFSITNHGLNLLAQTDGLAVSLIRPRKDPEILCPKSNPNLHPGPGPGVSPSSATNSNRPNLHESSALESHQIQDLNLKVDPTPSSSKAGLDGMSQSQHEEEGIAGQQGAWKIDGDEGRDGVGRGTGDVEMDELIDSTAALAGLGTSLDFLPRGVRRKKKDKDKNTVEQMEVR